MSQLVAAQEAYKKARNEWAAQVLLSEFLFVDYLLPRVYSLREEWFLPDKKVVKRQFKMKLRWINLFALCIFSARVDLNSCNS